MLQAVFSYPGPNNPSIPAAVVPQQQTTSNSSGGGGGSPPTFSGNTGASPPGGHNNTFILQPQTDVILTYRQYTLTYRVAALI